VKYSHGNDPTVNVALSATPATCALPGISFARPLSLSCDHPTIPGYHVVRLLGTGGMGAVYLATHLTLQRAVAIKVLKPELSLNPAFSERFLREARVAAGISHENVVSVHDAGHFGSQLYIALEFVDDGDLGALIRDGQPLAEAQALRIIAACTQGLAAIHRSGIVHRDIKPENIVLARNGTPKIADLGLARAMVDNDRITMAGQTMGTPSFMSPEQALGIVDVDERSDIYSLGVVLYVVLTGERPFKGATNYDTVHRILTEPIPDPRRINTQISAAAAGIIRRCLAKERGDRYPNASALLADIQLAQSRAAGGEVASAPSRHGVRLLSAVLSCARSGGRLFSSGYATWRSWSWAMRLGCHLGLAAMLLVWCWPVIRGFDHVSIPAPIRVVAASESNNPFTAIKGSIRGTHVVLINLAAEPLDRRALIVLVEQGLSILEHRQDGLTSRVEAAYPDAQRLSLSIRPIGADESELSLQVGPFGNRSRSQALIDALGK
jgi:serine/threonine protein kinase